MTPTSARRTAFASCLLAGLAAGCWKTTVDPRLERNVEATPILDRTTTCGPSGRPARVGETVAVDYRVVSTAAVCRCRDVNQPPLGLGDAHCGPSIELPDDDDGPDVCIDAGTTPGRLSFATAMVYPAGCRADARIDPVEPGLLHTTVRCDDAGTANLTVRAVSGDGNIWDELIFEFTADGGCP